MRILVLLTDAYGGRGGIALYNRNVLRALCEYPSVETVVAIPRVVYYKLEEMPAKLDYRLGATKGKLGFLSTCLQIAVSANKFDLVVCSHINLLPIASMLSLRFRCAMMTFIYGYEAWVPTKRRLTNYFCRRVNSFVCIRRLTGRRFRKWTKFAGDSYYLPNCIEESEYDPKPRKKELLEQYKLSGKAVIMTAGRLDGGDDARKGFEEVINVLPELKRRVPNIVYLILGDGSDRRRLEHKAKELGVDDITVFTGYVPESAKAEHYCLADAFVMPGSNALFDRYPYRFVFLEAWACGVPVVGCKLEEQAEADELDIPELIQVDPSSDREIINGTIIALSRPKGVKPAGISRFYFPQFKSDLHKIIGDVMRRKD